MQFTNSIPTTGNILVLTANKRLARHLMSVHAEQMVAAGSCAWATPRILSLEAWLNRSLAELGEDWRLLNDFASLRLWESVIEQETAGSELELLQLGATARKAQQAHRLLLTYDCQDHGYPLTEDQRIFLHWQERYREECRRRQWLDRGEVPSLIFQAIEEERLPLAETIVLCGFDQWAPELEKLHRLQRQRGGQIQRWKPHSTTPSAGAFCLPCPDSQKEVEFAARWARSLLDQGETSIGVVVLDLKERRALIERIFRHQIDPASALQTQEESSFTLSLGAPLIDQGLVHAALELLSADYRLTIEHAGFLLRTPYLKGSLREADERAKLDTQMRSFRQQEISLKRLGELAAEKFHAETLAEILTVLGTAASDTRKRLPGEWGTEFIKTLAQVGWPGEAALTSREYQIVKSFQEKLLPALSSLDEVSEPMSRRQALGLLRRVAAEIEFQVEAPTGPVQIIGLLESAGLEFDHLWVMGTTEDALPSPAHPNPFLPTALQVAYAMPHSGSDRELEFAKNVMDRLKVAAPQVVFSYPARQGDCELRPSPLIRDLPEITFPLPESQDAWNRLVANAPLMDSIEDAQGPVLAGGQGQGGTSILKDQALCPFRAFAHARLRGRALDPAQPGLDMRTRGDLVHKTLEFLWGELKGQEQLLSLDDEGRARLVGEVTVRALESYFAELVSPPAKILELETRRIQALVLEWLTEVESKRPPFVVQELEQEHHDRIGPLQIKTTIDRIDLLEDGSRAVLDYKTGDIKLDALLADRLLEPQLPIYSINGNAEAVAFAQVRCGTCKMLGIAREAEMLPKVAPVESNKKAQELGISSWSDLQTHWRSQLEQLAEDFVAGKAAVDPVDPKVACTYCDLSGFCRVAESQFVAIDAEEGNQ